MRVLMPDGMVMEIEKVAPIIEQRVTFNGREVRLCERSADIASANAIALISKAGVQDICDVTMGGTALLGNLKNEFVRGVLASLVRQGYVDFSDLKLQKTQSLVSQYKFDIFGYEASACFGAVPGWRVRSLPGYPFMGMGGAFPTASEAEDSEDAEDAEKEDCTDE